jgi:hypothetical protein
MVRTLDAAAWFIAVLMLGLPSASAADPSQSAPPQAQTDKAKSGKKPKKEKGAKKEKKPKVDQPAQDPEAPAPDEDPFATDTDAEPAPAPTEQVETGGKGARVSWKQHPSFRVGSIFRIDLEAKFQEDFHASYEDAPDLERAELHRNRIGVQGHLF